MNLFLKHLLFTDSTMLEAKRVLHEIAPDECGIITAERQSNGRGRRGTPWVNSRHAFLGTCILPKAEVTQLAGFSLACGVFVASLLEDPIMLKWPNDLLLNNSKCGGILVESAERIFIGIGLNFETAPHGFEAVMKTQRDIFHEALCQNLVTFYKSFLSHGFNLYKEEFIKRDFLSGKKITVEAQPGDSVGTEHTGIAIGVSDLGSLQLQTENGVVDVVSGHVIIR